MPITTHLVGCCKRNAKDWLGHKNRTDCKSSPFRSEPRYSKAALPLLAIDLFSGKRRLMHAVVAGTGLEIPSNVLVPKDAGVSKDLLTAV